MTFQYPAINGTLMSPHVGLREQYRRGSRNIIKEQEWEEHSGMRSYGPDTSSNELMAAVTHKQMNKHTIKQPGKQE